MHSASKSFRVATFWGLRFGVLYFLITVAANPPIWIHLPISSAPKGQRREIMAGDNRLVTITITEFPTEDEKAFVIAWENLCAHVERTFTDLVVLPEMAFHSWLFSQVEYNEAAWNWACSEHKRKMESFLALLAARSVNPSP
jgi:hypothetical protein